MEKDQKARITSENRFTWDSFFLRTMSLMLLCAAFSENLIRASWHTCKLIRKCSSGAVLARPGHHHESRLSDSFSGGSVAGVRVEGTLIYCGLWPKP